jgi:hypothetical protein
MRLVLRTARPIVEESTAIIIGILCDLGFDTFVEHE